MQRFEITVVVSVDAASFTEAAALVERRVVLKETPGDNYRYDLQIEDLHVKPGKVARTYKK